MFDSQPTNNGSQIRGQEHSQKTLDKGGNYCHAGKNANTDTGSWDNNGYKRC